VVMACFHVIIFRHFSEAETKVSVEMSDHRLHTRERGIVGIRRTCDNSPRAPLFRSVAFSLGYTYPRGYAKTFSVKL
jgi:hypothetical protein